MFLMMSSRIMHFVVIVSVIILMCQWQNDDKLNVSRDHNLHEVVFLKLLSGVVKII